MWSDVEGRGRSGRAPGWAACLYGEATQALPGRQRGAASHAGCASVRDTAWGRGPAWELRALRAWGSVDGQHRHAVVPHLGSDAAEAVPQALPGLHGRRRVGPAPGGGLGCPVTAGPAAAPSAPWRGRRRRRPGLRAGPPPIPAVPDRHPGIPPPLQLRASATATDIVEGGGAGFKPRGSKGTQRGKQLNLSDPGTPNSVLNACLRTYTRGLC